jgi:nitroreductase
MSFDTADTPRRSEHPVHSSFVERWSSRALSGEAIPEADLLTCFEAARWAPSGFNAQPVRFVYAHRDSEDFPKLLGLLNEKNRSWAHKAGAIVFVLSRTDFAFNGQTVQVSSHAFDAGAAWSAFAHQAHLLGYATRAIGGFDRKAAPEVLNLPDTYAAHVAVTIGRRASVHDLPETFHAQETPSTRRPLHTFLHQGQFRGESE